MPRALAICVTPAGTKTFYIVRRVEGKPERIRLGLSGLHLAAREFPVSGVDLAWWPAGEQEAAVRPQEHTDRDLDLCQKLVEDCFASEDYVDEEAGQRETARRILAEQGPRGVADQMLPKLLSGNAPWELVWMVRGWKPRRGSPRDRRSASRPCKPMTCVPRRWLSRPRMRARISCVAI